MSGREIAFVDTNVLVYAFDRAEIEKRVKASALIRELAEQGRLRLSTQVLQEFYVTVTRKVASPLPPEAALSIMDDLAAWPLFLVDFPTIRQAVELSVNHKLSLRDGLIVISAARSGANVLYTEDLNHGQKIAGVVVYNPFL